MSTYKVRVNMVVHAANEAEAAYITQEIMEAANHASRAKEPKLNDKWEHYKIVKVQPCQL